MNMLKTIYCFVLCLVNTLFMFGNDFSVKNLAIQKQLSSYSVMSLYQDERDLIWIGTRNGINIYDGTHIQIQQSSQSDSASIINNHILDIVGDMKGTIYMSSRQGLTAYSISEDRYTTLSEENVSALEYHKNQLLMAVSRTIFFYNSKDHSFPVYYTLPEVTATISDFKISGDSVFIGTELHGLFIYNTVKKQLSNPIKGVRVSKLFIDSRQNVWIGTWKDGLYKITDGCIENYTHEEGNVHSLCSNFVRAFCEDHLGNVWIGTYRGLNRYNNELKIFESNVSSDDANLSNSSIWSLLCDSQGTIWAGTYFGGLNYFNPNPKVKKYFSSESNRNQFITVGAMTQDADGRFWICTDGNGLCRLNVQTGEKKWYQHERQKNSLSQNNVKSVYFDRELNAVWIGTHIGGLNKLDLSTNRFSHYVCTSEGVSFEKSNTICDIIPYRDNLLLATHSGLYLFNKGTGNFTPLFKGTPDTESIDFSFDIQIDSTGVLWVAGDKDGVFAYNLNTKELIKYSPKSVEHKLSSASANCIYCDSKNRIWACMTQSGVDLYDPSADSFVNFNVEKNGLLNNSVYGVYEVAPDKLIFIMDNGFSYFDYQTKTAQNFIVGENFPLKAINQNAIYRADDGTIYIGGTDGMISFGLDFLEHQSDNYRIFPLKLYLNDKEVKVNDETGILTTALSGTKKITLPPHQPMFSILYAITDYLPYAKNDVIYKLENFSDSWSVLRDDNYITYTNLNPGTYKLIVKSYPNNPSTTVLSELEIEVLPPWYRTYWAYFLYAVALFVIVRVMIHTYENRLRLQTELKYERKHIEDIENLNRQKLQFFTNISHEFRTPLTLIIGEIELLMQVKSFLPSVYNRILNVYKSSMQLQSLISELLDFRKQELGHMHIKVSEHNMVKFLRDNYQLFKEYALSRNVEFNFIYASDEINVYYDEKQFQKVINNLLSNAFKHTPSGESIILKIEETKNRVLITVEDTGKGMAEKELDRIFDCFYQTDEEIASTRIGAGIGLALTKGIVELHHGTISVESYLNKGTIFYVTLFKGSSQFKPEELNPDSIVKYEKLPNAEQLQEVTEMEKIPDNELTEEKKFKILIVEDDASLLNLLKEIFEPYYFTELASTAQDALQRLEEIQPDLILSDIQMPGMSGLELCKKVKREIDTCHIPVVLLTARTGLEHKLEGLNTGADDYIVKPFETNILLARCRNLINNRIILQEKFTQQPHVTAQVFATNALDKEFMDKAMKIIDDNLDNYEFSATTFAQEMAIARTKLFVKIKAITGQTPNDLIVTMRLKKAAYLLKNDLKLSVAEISEQTGFKSPRYFSRCFKERYKYTPLNYRKGGSETDIPEDTSTSENLEN